MRKTTLNSIRRQLEATWQRAPVNHSYWVRNRKKEKDNFIIFNRSYNQEADSKYRIDSLLDIKKIVGRG